MLFVLCFITCWLPCTLDIGKAEPINSHSAPTKLELPPEDDPETEWSGFLEKCPSRSDARSQDYGPDIFSNLHTDRKRIKANSFADHL